MLTPTIRRLIVCGARAEREQKARPAQAQSEARADACNEAHRRRVRFAPQADVESLPIRHIRFRGTKT